jgi:hypothetical protein
MPPSICLPRRGVTQVIQQCGQVPPTGWRYSLGATTPPGFNRNRGPKVIRLGCVGQLGARRPRTVFRFCCIRRQQVLCYAVKTRYRTPREQPVLLHFPCSPRELHLSTTLRARDRVCPRSSFLPPVLRTNLVRIEDHTPLIWASFSSRPWTG